MKSTGNTILITGGGTGIGRALAHRFSDQGNIVIVTGRTQASLDEAVAGRDTMVAYTLDITDADAIQTFAQEVAERHPALNVVINNAGIMRFEDLTQAHNGADAEATVVTNLLGPIRLTAALTAQLVAADDAVIVNVTSGLAFVPLISTPTYSATKAGLHSYTVSLRHQLDGKVEVIELAPPAVQTDLTPGQATREGYLPLDDYIDEVMALFAQSPTPTEVLVERVKFLRNAEAEGRFEAALTAVNAH
ncbi:SDR family oxidoreductase [Sphingomonas sp.]|uniref:SDR family oxidoreductase n=1 Tax=Sphingomonas sp. TaxID=28214 RepID=UPI0025D7CB81|nr:SDR family NAD(P)-dependent oxidoreductase [Sphingomonas sp.]